MNTRKLLFVAIVAAMLLSAVALPAFAEDGTAMWVTAVRLAWNGRSSGGTDRIVALVHVRDENQAAVEGATVTAEWTQPNGTVLQQTAVTAFQGIATFQVWAGGGAYQLCVLDVTKEGWTYDPAQNLETCGSLIVKWPYNPPK